MTVTNISMIAIASLIGIGYSSPYLIPAVLLMAVFYYLLQVCYIYLYIDVDMSEYVLYELF